MTRIKKLAMGIAALAALALGGSAIAGAQSNGGGGTSDTPDQAVTGAPAKRAGAAAVKAAGGGTVRSVERSDEGGTAAYEVKVRRAGKTIEVTETAGYAVVKQAADDDQGDESDRGDGDGETNDDQGAQGHDRGDGETDD